MRAVLKREYAIMDVPAVQAPLFTRISINSNERIVSPQDVVLIPLDPKTGEPDKTRTPIVVSKKEFDRDFALSEAAPASETDPVDGHLVNLRE